MTRIIAGTAKGRKLRVPPGQSTRPTSDRVREAMFSSLESELGTLTGVRVLDLFAGSGALGFEAVSRGAAAAVLVESDARAATTIRASAKDLGMPEVRVVQQSVETFVTAAPDYGERFNVVLADPPYKVWSDKLNAILANLTDGWLAGNAVVVVERDRRSEPLKWPDGVTALRERKYGETMLWYGLAE